MVGTDTFRQLLIPGHRSGRTVGHRDAILMSSNEATDVLKVYYYTIQILTQDRSLLMAWHIDRSHSEIQFSVKHMMISTVRGRFKTFSGTIEADEQNPTAARVEVQIDAASIDTGNEQRDAHLRSADFLNVEQHP